MSTGLEQVGWLVRTTICGPLGIDEVFYDIDHLAARDLNHDNATAVYIRTDRDARIAPTVHFGRTAHGGERP